MLMQSRVPTAPTSSDHSSTPSASAIRQSDDLIYITEDFGHVLPDYSEPEADAIANQAIGDYAKSLGLPVPARKSLPKLRQMACDMALDDKLNSKKAVEIPGYHQRRLVELPATSPSCPQFEKAACAAFAVGLFAGGLFRPQRQSSRWSVLVSNGYLLI